jgi:hypothetical protein
MEYDKQIFVFGSNMQGFTVQVQPKRLALNGVP